MKAKRRGVRRTSTDSKKNGHEKALIQQDIVRRNLAEELKELGVNPIRRVRQGKGLTEREYDEYELIDLALLLTQLSEDEQLSLAMVLEVSK